MNKTILFATDGSGHSNHAVDYLCKLFANDPSVSIHLVNCTHVNQNPLLSTTADTDSLLPENKTHKQNLHKATIQIDSTIEHLKRHGIASDRITSTVVESGRDIATALISEAETRLADALIVGRRGVGLLGEVIMGSVSANLFRRCHNIPLWIVDGSIHSSSILIAVDGSVSSLLATDHLAHIFHKRTDIDFKIFHVHALLSGSHIDTIEEFEKIWDNQWCNKYLKDPEDFFAAPRQLLLEAGIPPENIVSLPQPINLEESNSIISHAVLNECGTIVLGRRKKVARGLFGSVSKRTIMQTQDMAMWVIG